MGLRELNNYLALVPSRENRTPCAWFPPKEVLCLRLYFGPQSKKPALLFPILISIPVALLWLSPLSCGHLLWILSFYLWDIRSHTTIWPPLTYLEVTQAPFWIPVLGKLQAFTCLGGGGEM